MTSGDFYLNFRAKRDMVSITLDGLKWPLMLRKLFKEYLGLWPQMASNVLSWLHVTLIYFWYLNFRAKKVVLSITSDGLSRPQMALNDL